jgi:hypothetical protein
MGDPVTGNGGFSAGAELSRLAEQNRDEHVRQIRERAEFGQMQDILGLTPPRPPQEPGWTNEVKGTAQGLNSK